MLNGLNSRPDWDQISKTFPIGLVNTHLHLMSQNHVKGSELQFLFIPCMDNGHIPCMDNGHIIRYVVRIKGSMGLVKFPNCHECHFQ